jgi:hypothetical protein
MLIQFAIPYRLPLLNTMLRSHWAYRARERMTIAWLVKKAIGRLPEKPLDKAVIHVYRHSPKQPDDDNLQGSVKSLLDVLQPVSKRHPSGLGIIRNDSPDCIVSKTVTHVKSNQVLTEVIIEHGN